MGSSHSGGAPASCMPAACDNCAHKQAGADATVNLAFHSSVSPRWPPQPGDIAETFDSKPLDLEPGASTQPGDALPTETAEPLEASGDGDTVPEQGETREAPLSDAEARYLALSADPLVHYGEGDALCLSDIIPELRAEPAEPAAARRHEAPPETAVSGKKIRKALTRSSSQIVQLEKDVSTIATNPTTRPIFCCVFLTATGLLFALLLVVASAFFRAL